MNTILIVLISVVGFIVWIIMGALTYRIADVNDDDMVFWCSIFWWIILPMLLIGMLWNFVAGN